MRSLPPSSLSDNHSQSATMIAFDSFEIIPLLDYTATIPRVEPCAFMCVDVLLFCVTATVTALHYVLDTNNNKEEGHEEEGGDTTEGRRTQDRLVFETFACLL